MKFSCTQENFNHGLQLISSIANKNVTLPILQNVLIKVKEGKITLSATNLEIGVRVDVRGKVEQEGEFTLPAQLLASYVNLLTHEQVQCQLIGNEFKINAGEQQSVIKGESAAEFPILPEIEDSQRYEVDKIELQSALQQVVIAASIDETRPEIAGVLFHSNEQNLVLAATDSYRLAEKKLKMSFAQNSINTIFPQRSAQELLRILLNSESEQVVMYISEAQLACEINQVRFVSRVIEGNFPDYAQIIPQQGKVNVLLSRDELIKTIKGAALFSKTGINDVKMSFDSVQKQVSVNAVNAQLGENTGTVTAAISGENVTVVFNHRFLVEGLQQLETDEVEMLVVDSISPAVLRSQGETSYTYVIMPIKQ